MYVLMTLNYLLNYLHLEEIMKNTYLGQVEVADGYNGDNAIIHLVEIVGGPNHDRIVYAVWRGGYFRYPYSI